LEEQRGTGPVESLGKDEPTGPQRFQPHPASECGHGGMHIFHAHTFHAKFHEFADRQAAAPVFQSHDDSRDAMFADDALKRRGISEHGRIRDLLGTGRGIPLDETDYVQVQIVAPPQLSRNDDAEFLSAEDDDILRRRRESPRPVQNNPIAQHEHGDQPDADHEDAAPNQQTGEEQIEDTEDQRSAADRLSHPQYFLDASPDTAEVIEIAVVKGNLKDSDDRQQLKCEARQLHVRFKLRRVVPESQFGAADYGKGNQEGFQQTKQQRLYRYVLAEDLDHELPFRKVKQAIPIPKPKLLFLEGSGDCMQTRREPRAGPSEN